MFLQDSKELGSDVYKVNRKKLLEETDDFTLKLEAIVLLHKWWFALWVKAPATDGRDYVSWTFVKDWEMDQIDDLMKYLANYKMDWCNCHNKVSFCCSGEGPEPGWNVKLSIYWSMFLPSPLVMTFS